MKEIILSIRPKWVVKICHKIGKLDEKPIYEKRIEVRKTRPKIETPFKCLIYCTRITDKKHCRDEFDVGIWKGNEHVIGEFTCDKIYEVHNLGNKFIAMDGEKEVTNIIAEESCVDYYDLADYFKYIKKGYAWHISNLVIYDKPKELSEFGLTRPPQSWQYVLDK